MVMPGMVLSDWVSMVMCSCGHLANWHMLHPPVAGTTNPVLGTCKDCLPFDNAHGLIAPAENSFCDGFTPRTTDDAEKLVRALGIVFPEYMAEQDAKAEEIRAMDLGEVDMSRSLATKLAAGTQPTPHGTGREITPLVIADMEARREFGTAKYGEGLTAFNGRDALQDAYQEALDLVVYLRQMIEERDAQLERDQKALGRQVE